jgi:tol-pal system protein YbgF
MQNLEAGYLRLQEQQADQNRRLSYLEDTVTDRFDELELALAGVRLQIENSERSRAPEQARPAMRTQVPEPPRPETPPEPDEPPAPPTPEQRKTIPEPAKAPREPAPGATEESEPAAKAEPAPEVRSPAEQKYDQAVALIMDNKYQQARPLLNEFLETWPDHELAPNALYWLGETFYDEKDFTQAILTFKRVGNRFPEHHKNAAALLKIGYAYEELGDLDNARFHFELLLSEFPDSDAAALARERLAELSS